MNTTTPNEPLAAASSNHGRAALLPHNIEAEESVLGAMLLSPQSVIEAAETLTTSDFYRSAHGHIFDAIVAVEARGDRPDPVTVADHLNRQGLLEQCGGSIHLVDLLAGTPTIAAAANYARIVHEHAQLRRLIFAAGEITELGYSTPTNIPAAVDQAEQILFDAAGHVRRVGISTLEDVLTVGLDRLEKLYETGQTITGVATGFPEIDHTLLGLQPGSLYTIGARPAMGKSAFSLNIAANAALRSNVTTLFVSLEMAEVDLTNRLLASETKIELTKLLSGQLAANDWPKINAAIGRIAGKPLRFLCSSNVNLMELRARARHMRARDNLGLIIIDYLQLIETRTGAETRQIEVAEISRGLKRLAIELQIPVIAVAQLSRNLEHRTEKRPVLADLKESGAIEQDSDVVIFIYRDEIYNPDTIDLGTAEIIIAKNRQGPTATKKLAYLGHQTTFASMP